jgi:hypothetical protein
MDRGRQRRAEGLPPVHPAPIQPMTSTTAAGETAGGTGRASRHPPHLRERSAAGAPVPAVPWSEAAEARGGGGASGQGQGGDDRGGAASAAWLARGPAPKRCPTALSIRLAPGLAGVVERCARGLFRGTTTCRTQIASGPPAPPAPGCGWPSWTAGCGGPGNPAGRCQDPAGLDRCNRNWSSC